MKGQERKCDQIECKSLGETNFFYVDGESNLVRLKSPRQPYTTMESKLTKPLNE